VLPGDIRLTRAKTSNRRDRPGTAIGRLLLPAEPRDFPFRRALRGALRALHILAGGMLLGGHFFGVDAALVLPWAWATALFGAALFATDLHASAAVLFELRGVVILAKIVAMLLVPVFWNARVELIGAILLAGALSSHLSGKWRHRLLFGRGRVTPDTRHG
jgi:hypothetical protein